MLDVYLQQYVDTVHGVDATVYARGLEVVRGIASLSSLCPLRLAVDVTGKDELLFSLFGVGRRGADVWVDSERELLFTPLDAGWVGETRRASWAEVAAWLDGTETPEQRRAKVRASLEKILEEHAATFATLAKK